MFEILPEAIKAVFEPMAVAMTRPTFQRFVIIALATILCRGRRTITRIIWIIRPLAKGDVSDYHRVLSRASWELSDLGRVLIIMILDWVPDE